MAFLDDVRAALEAENRANGTRVAVEVLDAMMLGLETERELEGARQRVTWEVWDWTSPINGVSAEEIRQRPDVIPGEAYIISVDGVPTIFQPHSPNEAGFTAIQDTSVAQEQIDLLATQLAMAPALEKARRRQAQVLGLQQARVDAGEAIGTSFPSVAEIAAAVADLTLPGNRRRRMRR
jgi:hypothetical protein